MKKILLVSCLLLLLASCSYFSPGASGANPNGEANSNGTPESSTFNTQSAPLAETMQVTEAQLVGAIDTPAAGPTIGTQGQNLPFKIIPYDYTLVDVGDGWKEGKVALAFENISAQPMKVSELVNIPSGTSFIVQTEEGQEYQGEIVLQSTMMQGLPSETSTALTGFTNALIPPGFRFSRLPMDQFAVGFFLRWKSAAAATPTNIVFPDYPAIDFALPEPVDPLQSGQSLLFPFDAAPVEVLPASNLAGLALWDLPGELLLAFTGRCATARYFNSKDERMNPTGGDRAVFLELMAKNEKQLEETRFMVYFDVTVYHSDGLVSQIPGAIIEDSPSQTYYQQVPGLGEMALGPGVTKNVYLYAFTPGGEFTNPSSDPATDRVYIVFPLAEEYKLYDATECITHNFTDN